MSKRTSDTDKLTDRALDIIKSALETGKIKVGDFEYTLQASDIMDLAMKLASNRAKKLTDVEAPEDYELKPTRGDE